MRKRTNRWLLFFGLCWGATHALLVLNDLAWVAVILDFIVEGIKHGKGY